MAKITTIIDIGSNSARMAIFKRTSRFGFHLIHEAKSKVRISEGSYENGSYLQERAMQRGIQALSGFKRISKAFKSRKLICVATSAVRDAPNKSEFVGRARRECGINIKVIDGAKEAYFGALACANLLHHKSGITIDIGGGSTELACLKDGKIVHTTSLNLGSIRLKELYFDHAKAGEAYEYVKKYVLEHIQEVEGFCRDFYDSHNFNGCFENLDSGDSKNLAGFNDIDSKDSKTSSSELCLFGIGGSIRAFAKYEMSLESYPLSFLHGYELSSEKIMPHLQEIVNADVAQLSVMGFDDSRLDSIRPGLLILLVILEVLGIKKFVISGVGVREGAFLHDMLRGHRGKIPNNINPSVEYLKDIFLPNNNSKMISKMVIKRVKEIFALLKKQYSLKEHFLYELEIAAKIYDIGVNFNFYQAHKHSAYIALHSLNYGFSHMQKYTISTILEYSSRKRPKIFSQDSRLLPSSDVLQILSFIFAVALVVGDCVGGRVKFGFDNGVLQINTHSPQIAQDLRELMSPKIEQGLDFDVYIS